MSAVTLALPAHCICFRGKALIFYLGSTYMMATSTARLIFSPLGFWALKLHYFWQSSEPGVLLLLYHVLLIWTLVFWMMVLAINHFKLNLASTYFAWTVLPQFTARSTTFSDSVLTITTNSVTRHLMILHNRFQFVSLYCLSLVTHIEDSNNLNCSKNSGYAVITVLHFFAYIWLTSKCHADIFGGCVDKVHFWKVQ